MMSAHKIKVTALSGDLLLLFLLGHIFASVSLSHLDPLSLLSSQKCSLTCATILIFILVSVLLTKLHLYHITL